jgi:flagellar basal-body rod protein FlgC
MSLFTIFKVSTQGMTAQRERLEAAAANLANSNSTRTSNGKMYQRRDVIFAAQDIKEEWMENSIQNGFLEYQPAQGVKTEIALAKEDQFILQRNPHHPDADANGYIKLPDVDPLEETINMMSASRSFEANATVFNTAKEIAKISLNLNDV